MILKHDPAAQSSAKRIIFLTVFIDLIGFGIYIALGPFIARQFEADPEQIGWLMSIYSIMQFLFAPVWGHLSDRYGRRPILLMSLLGGSLSYLVMAWSPSFWWLFLSRAFAGLFAANIATAHAYMSDITSEKDRASGMGLIGAAFGIGFIIGPTLGSVFGYLGQKLGDAPPFGLHFPALMAFVITFLNFVWAYARLPETLNLEEKTQVIERRLRWFRGTLGTGLTAQMILIYFVTNLAMPLMEVMLFPFVSDRFNWNFMQSSIGFAVVGLIMAFTQGFLVRKYISVWGERKMAFIGLLLMGVSFAMIAFAESVAFLACAMTLLAVGNGFVRPTLLGIVSLLSPVQEQGKVLGSTQSAASLGRIFGPIIGGWLYIHMGMGSPFLAASAMTLVGFLWFLIYYKRLPDQRKQS